MATEPEVIKTLDLRDLLSMSSDIPSPLLTETAWPPLERLNADNVRWHTQNNLNWIDSGDVVCFSGTGIRARCIELFTWSEVSHVGIIIRVGPPEASILYLLESTGHDDGLVCQMDKVAVMHGIQPSARPHDHHQRSGVHLVLLQDKLRRYIQENVHHSVALMWVVKSLLRRSHQSPDWDRSKVTRNLVELASVLCGSNYDRSAFHYLQNGFATSFGTYSHPIRLMSSAAEGSFTCTELVGVALYRSGMINGDLSIGEILRPKAFIDRETIGPLHWAGAELAQSVLKLTITNKHNV